MEIPEFLKNMLLKQYNEKIVNQIVDGYTKQRKVTLRVNTIKSTIEKVKETLSNANINYTEVDWNKYALIIENVREDDIRKLQIYENGEIYMQSLSSMIPAIVLEPKKGENILDMAAAPGGKTTQIAAISDNMAIITACEKNKIRADRLKYNIEKQGVTCAYVMQTDSRKLDSFFSFDKILLDAPCSGSGTLQIAKTIEKNFTEDLIHRSVKVQEELLTKAFKILKKGGTLIYSTCSILYGENEEIINKILKRANAEIVPIDNRLLKNVPLLPTKIDGTICVFPNELYEGFFIAKMRKIS